MPNIVVGAGKIYFNERVDGVLQGEILLQETPELSYAISTDRFKEYGSDGPVAELIVDEPTKIDRAGKFKAKDITAYNLALFALATQSDISTATGSVTDDAINAGVALSAGRYYQLGLATRPYVGTRAITSAVIKTGATIYTEGADYTLDATLARLYIPAGSAAVGAICTADYDTTDATWEHVESTDNKSYSGELRFVADNTVGSNRDYLFPAVTLSGSGDNNLKSRTASQELGFEFAIKKPTDGAAMYIDGRPV